MRKIKLTPHKRIVLLLGATLALGACDGNIRKTLGVSHQAPDEFSVIARPPLSVPENGFTLPAPATGGNAVYIPESQAMAKARETLFPGLRAAQKEARQLSSAERALLARAGRAADNIRQIIAEENQARMDRFTKNQPPLYRFMDRPVVDPLNTIVDAEAERKRLLMNERRNLPVNHGDVPVLPAPGSKTGLF